jgi:hypothetical protein
MDALTIYASTLTATNTFTANLLSILKSGNVSLNGFTVQNATLNARDIELQGPGLDYQVHDTLTISGVQNITVGGSFQAPHFIFDGNGIYRFVLTKLMFK